MVESSNTGGVKPMQIGSRMVRERERLMGMTAEERAWRKQYLKDQILSPNEPVHVPEYWQERINPIRRFYRMPLDKLFTALEPALGSAAGNARYLTGKFLMFGMFVYSAHYYFKYNANDWTKKGGWRVTKSRTYVLPGDENYPQVSQRTKPSDYANRKFYDSPI